MKNNYLKNDYILLIP